jgi:hypothetical protein
LIEVTTKKGESLEGTFLNASEGSISLERKRRNVAVPRAEIARVSLCSSKHRKYTLVGLGIGAGAGAGIGAAVVESRPLQTGANAKYQNTAIVVAVCATAALVGALVGSWLGGRGTTVVYRAK